MGNKDELPEDRSHSCDRDSLPDDGTSKESHDYIVEDSQEFSASKPGRDNNDVAEDLQQLRASKLERDNIDVAEEDDDACEAEMKPLVLEAAQREDEENKLHTKEDTGDDGNNDDDNDEKTAKDESKLQDQGWAWIVCFGCFFSHFITGGFERSDGVMFLEFTEKFQESAQLTAWPAAISSTMRLCMGPFATAVSNRYSVRTATMVGSLVFAFALLVCGFAPNVPFLIFSYGILQGIGRGLIYAPGLVIVGNYFNQRRGLAVGLSTAGVGAGTFIFPPVVEWLFHEFGFQGAFLILAAVALNFCVVAALYRPLFVHRNIVLGKRSRNTDEEEALRSTTKNQNKCDMPKEPEYEVINDTVPSHSAESDEKNYETQHPQPDRDVAKPQQDCMDMSQEKSKQTGCLKSVFNICFPTEVQRKDSPKRKLIELSLLKNYSFLFFCFSICLFNIAFKSAFTFLPALAASQGVSVVSAAYLLSISGVLDTIGRILAGYILDIDCIRPFRPIVYNSVVFVTMVLSFLSPFLRNFVEFALLFGLYGMLTGTYVSQKLVILVDILGQEKLSSSFGLLICFQGVGTFFGPPLSGLLKDIFGRFHETFFLGGLAMALAGVLMIISNIYRVLHNRRTLNGETVVAPAQ